MNDFNLPIIKGTNSNKRILSMDEYLEFVMFNIQHTLNKTAYRQQKQLSVVNVPFTLD